MSLGNAALFDDKSPYALSREDVKDSQSSRILPGKEKD
jgi:hypothetical protein